MHQIPRPCCRHNNPVSCHCRGVGISTRPCVKVTLHIIVNIKFAFKQRIGKNPALILKDCGYVLICVAQLNTSVNPPLCGFPASRGRRDPPVNGIEISATNGLNACHSGPENSQRHLPGWSACRKGEIQLLSRGDKLGGGIQLDGAPIPQHRIQHHRRN